MCDFISKARKKQLSLAKNISTTLKDEIRDNFNKYLNEEAERLGISYESRIEKHFLDPELIHDIYLALQGYSDWLASELLKNTNQPKSIKIPTCSNTDIKMILEKYYLDLPLILSEIIKTIQEKEITLPYIGTFKGDQIIVNWNELTKWANHYNWA